MAELAIWGVVALGLLIGVFIMARKVAKRVKGTPRPAPKNWYQ